MAFTTNEFTKPPRPRWVLPVVVTAVVVALIALVAAVVVGSADDGAPAVPAPRPAPTQGLDLTAAPTKLEWKLIDGVRLPFAGEGPSKVAGPLASGYSHTPQGAVVAAWQISTRLATSTDYEQVMANQVRGTEAQRTQVRLEVANVRNLTSNQFSARFAQPVGFRVVSYDNAFAQIYFAVQSPAGGYDFTPRAVLWDGKDWQYQLISGLPALPNSTSIADFTTF